MFEIQLAFISLAVVYGLLDQIEGHRYDWSSTQFIWHKLNPPRSLLEIPMQSEFLIQDLKTYTEVRDLKDQYYNESHFKSSTETLVGGPSVTTIEWKPKIEISINDPISETNSTYLDLLSKIANVTSLNAVRKLWVLEVQND